MIKPNFTLEQTLDKIILRIHIKYIKTQDIQVDLTDSQLKMYANPYFLSLKFPISLLETENSNYDISNGILTVELEKEIPEIIQDLEFKINSNISIDSLTESVNSRPIKPLVQDLTLDLSSKKVEKENPGLEKKYGFNQEYSGLGKELSLLSNEMLEISDFDSIFSDFKLEYLQRINRKFCIEYYIQDLQDLNGIDKDINAFTSEYKKLLLLKQSNNSSEIIDSKEIQEIQEIKRKEYFIQDEKSIYLGLVDLMFSYSYNYLLNQGEENSESCWNLVKTSPTLSAFLTFDTLQQVVWTSAKASLSWPLLRNWEFTLKVLKHTTIIFKLGKKGIVKALLEMKRILEGDERTFTICQIWIIDYLSWITTSASDKIIADFASQLNHFSLEKSDIYFNETSLLQLEQEYTRE